MSYTYKAHVYTSAEHPDGSLCPNLNNETFRKYATSLIEWSVAISDTIIVKVEKEMNHNSLCLSISANSRDEAIGLVRELEDDQGNGVVLDCECKKSVDISLCFYNFTFVLHCNPYRQLDANNKKSLESVLTANLRDVHARANINIERNSLYISILPINEEAIIPVLNRIRATVRQYKLLIHDTDDGRLFEITFS